MANGYGFSFQPGSNDIAMGGSGASRQASPASNIEIRSLRLPKVEAPRSVAPMSLLQSPGSAGAPAGFDPRFLNLLSAAFRPVVPAQAPMLPPSQGASNTVSRPYAGPMTQGQPYRAPDSSNPFAPAPPATPEYVGDVPPSQGQGYSDFDSMLPHSTYDPILDMEDRAEKYATRLGGGENFWDNVASYLATQAYPVPRPATSAPPRIIAENPVGGGGSWA